MEDKVDELTDKNEKLETEIFRLKEKHEYRKIRIKQMKEQLDQ